MQITIKSIERKTINTPNGTSPTAVKVGVQANEIPHNRWASCFETAATKGWKNGDTVEIDRIEEKGKYLNLILVKGSAYPKPAGSGGEALAVLQRIEDSINLLGTILQRIEEKGGFTASSKDVFQPGDDVSKPSGGSSEDQEPPPSDDLPF